MGNATAVDLPAKQRIASFDGCELAVYRLGEGRPVLLLHGLFSNAYVNWVRFGHAQRLVDAGFEVVMTDLRTHGASDRPHDPAAYPPGVLVKDLRFLVETLGLTDYDLVGFSLGARTAAEAVIEGLRPRRLVLAGMGLEGLTGWEERVKFFHDAIERFAEVRAGDPAFTAVSFMKTMKVDLLAARLLVDAVVDVELGHLDRIAMPTAVIAGDQDRANGSPEALAAALPNARHIEVPGTHMSSVTRDDLGAAIAGFLTE